jgi:retron-type reverse transcriptase
LLLLAYDNIKSKLGNKTCEGTLEILEDISMKAITEIAEQLKNESFQFKTAERVQITKPGGTGKHLLTGVTSKDKIVQEGIRMILNAIYEPLFRDDSHGFRPKKGQHTALKSVNQKFQYTV